MTDAARFATRVESTAANRPVTTPAPANSAKETTGNGVGAPRVTAGRARRIAHDLTAIDRAVIESLSIIHLATGQQLRRLHWPDTPTGQRSARHHLAKLTSLRVLARLERRIGGVRAGSDGYVYALDVVGQRIAETEGPRRYRRPWTPGLPYLAHALAVSECYVRLKTAEAAGHLDVLFFESEPACWRRYPGPHGRSLTLKPDAFVITTTHGSELRHFLEVDRGTEHAPVITRKGQAYIDYWCSGQEQQASGVFPSVLFVVPDSARLAAVSEALGRLDADAWRLFQVCTAAELLDAFTTAAEAGEGA
jgi:hypothetical protein